MTNGHPKPVIFDTPDRIELYQMTVIEHILRYSKIYHPMKTRLAARTAREKFGCTGRVHASLARQMQAKIERRTTK